MNAPNIMHIYTIRMHFTLISLSVYSGVTPSSFQLHENIKSSRELLTKNSELWTEELSENGYFLILSILFRFVLISLHADSFGFSKSCDLFLVTNSKWFFFLFLPNFWNSKNVTDNWCFDWCGAVRCVDVRIFLIVQPPSRCIESFRWNILKREIELIKEKKNNRFEKNNKKQEQQVNRINFEGYSKIHEILY